MPDLASMMGSLKAAAGRVMGQEPPAPPAPPDAAPAADPYADAEAILQRVKAFRDEFGKREHRRRFLVPIERNLRFYRGDQWGVYDGGLGYYRPSRLPKHIPQPVTNIFADTMDTVNAVFGRIEPKLLWRPGAPDEPEDRATADVASRAIEVIEDEVSLRMTRQMLAAWVGFAGGAFLETGYDPDPRWGTREVALEQCPACQATQPPGAGACEACGDAQPLQPVTQTVPKGKMYVEVASLLEMYFDPSITEFAKHRKLQREKCLAVDDAKERWPAFAEQIAPNVAGTAEEYMFGLPTLAPMLDERATRNAMSPSLLLNNRVTERWHWELPSAAYPEGLLAIVVGPQTLVYAKPLPYWAKSDDGGKRHFLPFTWFPQKLVPGTFWPKSVADDIAGLQRDRNKWQSALMLCGMRMGMPIWLRPRGANVGGLTQGGGEAGAVLDYNALGPGAAKPERIPGQPLPMSFVEWMTMIDAAVEKIAKTFDILKGARPEGVSAGIALQILQERGLSAYGPLFIMWEAGWAAWAGQAIEIFRQFATEERLLRIKGRDGAWQVEKFIGADLSGRVDCIAEAGSSTPRSTLADRAEIEQLMAYRVLDPADPETRGKILELYGKTNWLPSMTLDTKNAIMEDEAFRALAALPIWQHASPEDVTAIEMLPDYPSAVAIMQEWQGRVPQMAGQPPLEWPKVYAALDGHAVHSREHGNFGKSESFREFPPIIQAMVEKHKAYHDQLLIQQMAAVQGGGQIQGGFMQPAPGGAMPQQQPMNTSSSGRRLSGDYQELQSDVASGGNP
jgi:hypothetical protein